MLTSTDLGDNWVPAFEQEWAAALEESRRTFSLAHLRCSTT
ncbi:hypothetical protein [Streptomyces sp. 3214.6]|nr:hypothetical protein [Streptomyces sp. 3214.6]